VLKERRDRAVVAGERRIPRLTEEGEEVMMQGILVRMDERQSRLLVTFAVVSIVNAYAFAQLLLAM
jgi:hypothetical protein